MLIWKSTSPFLLFSVFLQTIELLFSPSVQQLFLTHLYSPSFPSIKWSFVLYIFNLFERHRHFFSYSCPFIFLSLSISSHFSHRNLSRQFIFFVFLNHFFHLSFFSNFWKHTDTLYTYLSPLLRYPSVLSFHGFYYGLTCQSEKRE